MQGSNIHADPHLGKVDFLLQNSVDLRVTYQKHFF